MGVSGKTRWVGVKMDLEYLMCMDGYWRQASHWAWSLPPKWYVTRLEVGSLRVPASRLGVPSLADIRLQGLQRQGPRECKEIGIGFLFEARRAGHLCSLGCSPRKANQSSEHCKCDIFHETCIALTALRMYFHLYPGLRPGLYTLLAFQAAGKCASLSGIMVISSPLLISLHSLRAKKVDIGLDDEVHVSFDLVSDKGGLCWSSHQHDRA